MRMVGVRGLAAALLLAGLLGCGGKQQQQGGGSQTEGGQGGGGAKAQSAGNPSALDQELKRQGEIYKEYLMHNAQKAQQDREADKKLLEGMRKQQQEALKNQIRELQRRQGLTGGKNKASGQGKAKQQSDQKDGGGDGQSGDSGQSAKAGQ